MSFVQAVCRFLFPMVSSLYASSAFCTQISFNPEIHQILNTTDLNIQKTNFKNITLKHNKLIQTQLTVECVNALNKFLTFDIRTPVSVITELKDWPSSVFLFGQWLQQVKDLLVVDLGKADPHRKQDLPLVLHHHLGLLSDSVLNV